jgi:hypothetical protein
MRTVLSLATLFGLLFAASVRADEQADLQTVIDKAIKAHGAEKAGKNKAHTFKLKGTVHVMDMDIPFTGDYQVQEPDKVRQTTTATVGGNEFTYTLVLNNDKGWMQLMGNTQELDKDTLAAAKEEIYAGVVTSLTPLKEKGYKLAALAEKKFGERPAAGISVSREGHKDIFLYFDKETSMLVASERQARDVMGGQEYKQETRYGNYKEVEGAKQPHKLEILRDGEKFLEGEITEFKMLDKLDDNTFAKP